MMQAVATLKQQSSGRYREQPQTMSAMPSWLTRIFGCWHREMSRPFTLQSESYRVCLECGAHRHFDTQTWEMTGPFYYESAAASLYQNTTTAVKAAAAASTARQTGRLTLRAA